MTDKQMIQQETLEGKSIAQAKPISWLTPAVDIYETADELILLADLPGVEENGLQLQVSRGLLTLEAEIKTAEEQNQRGFYRQFKLSERIDADAGNAALKDGVLSLRLPKSAAAKPKRIAVQTLH
ncbi:MAG: Hsp20/alpha crystallin family protein [Deltaproteobacteria bacterium]|jgi:HSP20 family molecular chaperone IbpA|nr:Hsp20/alpha crystallin family protein [Deltaproteobacteria bacterium]MCW8893269.1 Hsp20/alpha crystallin family protein [Deltaproteobacteria bacterium]MCW9050325.1 Hsp20/alpha crystallin family protein [Deltaproteobacteria bacterium]